MAARRASQAGGVARVSFANHVEHVVVEIVSVVGGAVILVGDKNDGQVGIGPKEAVILIVDTGLWDEGHTSRLQLVFFPTAGDAHGPGEAGEDVCKLQIGRVVVSLPPGPGRRLDVFNPARA